MEKGALQKDSNNIVSMDKSINQYDIDNNRDTFFDNVFNSKFGSEFTQEISNARESWRAINGDKSKYTFAQST
jgi:hypothetical protein